MFIVIALIIWVLRDESRDENEKKYFYILTNN